MPLILFLMSETFILFSFLFSVPVLQIYMYHMLLILDSFFDLVFKALVFHVDLQSEY